LLSVTALQAGVLAQDQGKCSDSYSRRTINGEVVEDLGIIGLPLRGWVGNLSTGRPAAGMTIDSYSEDGKKRLATTTTDDSGAFSFPDLKPGTYYLKGSAKGLVPLRILVQLSDRTTTIACILE
jgi:hypothetical protein